MSDQELLRAINCMLQDFENRLTAQMDNLDERLTTQVNSLDERLTMRMDNLDERLTTQMDNLDERLTTQVNSLDERLTTRMDDLDHRLTTRMDEKHADTVGQIKVLFEAEFRPTLETLVEAHQELAEGQREIVKRLSGIESLAPRVDVLETVARLHSEDIRELKKAQ